jgi:hypothetical protein
MDSFIGTSFNQNFSVLDDSTNEHPSFSRYLGGGAGANLSRNQPTSNTPSRLFRSSVLLANTTSHHNVSAHHDSSDADAICSSNQSSIYTQFKIDTNKFVDEESNLVDLLKSYSSICSENSHFLREKLQYLTSSRQK